MIKFSNLPNLSKIEKQLVTSPNGEPLVYHYTLYFKEDSFVASGSSFDDQDAKKKAYSEAIERLFIRHVNAALVKKWRFNDLNTTDCLAVGFSLDKSIERSNYEAVERSCRLLFEEGSIAFQKLQSQNLSDKLKKFSQVKFTKLSFYKTDVIFYDFLNRRRSVLFVLAFEEIGEECFLGYSVGDELSVCLEHSSIEAYRNKIIFQNYHNFADQWVDDIYYKKLNDIIFDQSNIKELLSKRAGAHTLETVLPRISWQVSGFYRGSFLSRSFVDGFLD